jgi:hypothetical protein
MRAEAGFSRRDSFRLFQQYPPIAALPEPRDRLDGSIFSGKPSWSAPTMLPKTPYQKIVPAKKNGAPALAILCLLEIA